MLTALATAGTAAPAGAALVDLRGTALQQGLNTLTLTVPGVVARVDDPANGFHWEGTAGVANVATGAPSSAANRFRAGSVTKMLQAVTFLRLQEAGRLDLDDTVEQHLPGLLPDGSTITIRHLLRHQSGLVDYFPLRFPDDQSLLQHRYTVWDPIDLVRPALDAPRAAAPGTRSIYSNTNFVLSARILEAVTGQPYEQVIHDQVVAPLGLADTYVTRREQVGIEGPHQTGYLPADVGPLRFQDHTRLTEFTASSLSWGYGAGPLVSNLADLSRTITALFGGRLLTPESLAEMSELVLQSDLDPLELPSNLGFPDRYGLGLMAWDESCGQYLGHQGGTADFVTVVAHHPTTRRTVVINANLAAGITTQAQVLRWVEEAMC